MGKQTKKSIRQSELKEKIKKNPFLTDEELAQIFEVSVPTIRFDRAALGIKEYRERIKNVATQTYQKTKTNSTMESFEILDVNPMIDGIGSFKAEAYMCFSANNMVRGSYIYEYAENLAINVIGAKAALIEIANIKYKEPIYVGDKLLAKCEVIRTRNNEYVVWVKIKCFMKEVFRAKFILKAVETERL